MLKSLGAWELKSLRASELKGLRAWELRSSMSLISWEPRSVGA